MNKQKPYCPYCNSYDVVIDADAEWDEDSQEWVVASVYQGGHCQSCESEIKHMPWKNI